jgi:hypothetical protein
MQSTPTHRRRHPHAAAALAVVTALGCAPAASGTPEPVDGSSSSSTDPVDGPEDSSTVSSADSSASSDSSGPAPVDPGCGNGIVEPDEQCDEESPACSECAFVCGIADGFILAVPPSHLEYLRGTRALNDGSGDLLVTSHDTFRRVTGEGAVVWAATSAGTPAAPALEANDEFAWAAWATTYGGHSRGRLTQHSLVDGSILQNLVFDGMPGGRVSSVARGPGDTVLVMKSIDTAPGVAPATIEQQTFGGRPLGTIAAFEGMVLPDGTSDLSLFDVGLDGDRVAYISGTELALDVDYRAFFVKLDKAGGQQWRYVEDERSWLGATTEHPIPQDDGGVIFFEQVALGGPSVGHYTNIASRIIRLDANGDTTWTLDPSVPNGHNVQLFGLHPLGDGRFVGVGAELISGFGAAWLGYFDADANLLCSVTYPDPGGEESGLTEALIGADGTLMIHGYTDTIESPDLLASSRWIARLNPY